MSTPRLALRLSEEVTLDDGMVADGFTFNDSHGLPRTAWMLANDHRDAFGSYGGCMHEFDYQIAQGTRMCAAQSHSYPGFGFTVNHVPSGSVSSRFFAGTYENTFVGRHHAIRTYHWTLMLMGQPVDITTSWFFATGRDAPTFAITYDLRKTSDNKVIADTRSPYGDIAWDGGEQADVSGLGWGDHLAFETVGDTVTQNSGWTYDKPNHVPYVFAYTRDPDAEMGVVQTESIQRHDAGGYDGYKLWGKQSLSGPMPQQTSWPFQLNQYELPYTSASKRLAWGSNFGAVGSSSYPTYGDEGTASGYPFLSYSTFVVLDEHSANPTQNAVHGVEAAEATRLQAQSNVHIITHAKAGVARPDKRELETPGYNPIFGTWEAKVQNPSAPCCLAFDVALGHALPAPTLIVHAWHHGDAVEIVSPRGPMRADIDYFVSSDAAKQRLFISFAQPIQGHWPICINPATR